MCVIVYPSYHSSHQVTSSRASVQFKVDWYHMLGARLITLTTSNLKSTLKLPISINKLFWKVGQIFSYS